MTPAELQERLSEVVGGKYQVFWRLGGGGMSQVFLARHRFHGGLFAIKVLAEHLAQDRSLVSRFEREARLTASLANHPNVAAIFDIGEGNGLYYLVMQFVAGEDLASYLRRAGRLPLAEAANVIAQATEALSCAEAKRIVHRDLKPANMLLDESGRVKLLDFGISRIADFSDGLTRAGEAVGTPYYMSPEQIRGEPCDIRSDLYSLGIVFFELLTGRRPFEQETATAIQMAHLTTEAPSLLAFDSQLPEACDAIIHKMIAKRPEDRFQSTAELLQVLLSNGANAGPGTLRPSVDPGLREAIERIQALPLDAATLSGATSVPAAAGGATSVAAALEAQQSPVNMTSASSAAVDTPIPAPQVRKPHSISWLAISGAVASVVVIVAIVLWLRHPRSSTGTDMPANMAAAKTLPAVYSDAHGRMLLVPAGDFHFGAASDGSMRTVSLPAFYIDETEVSNEEYRGFCQATGRAPPQSRDFDQQPDYPVTNVSYDDAVAYATWAGRRLPTEEEWEKAARGADERTYPWGDAAWTEGVPVQLQPVTSEPLRRSPYGAYNMAGNAWEWTATPYAPTAEDNAGMKKLLKDQSFSADWRTIKGGSFAPGSREDFDISKRRGLPIDARSVWIGFRCVRSGAPTP
jgi:eukaryotic-like serine/threonine-protein kinase